MIVVFVPFISAAIGVPFLPTHRKQAIKMIEFANIQPGMTVVDLGSGAGRLMFLAAKKGANVIGYELNPFLVLWTWLMIKIKRLTNVKVKMRSLYEADLKNVDVVLAFLFPEYMKKLEPKLFSEMKPGSTIISYSFSIPHHTPLVQEEGIMVYKISA